MGLVRRGSRVRQIIPVYLIVNASSAATARARLQARAESNGFSNVSVVDSGGWTNSEITFEGYTAGDFGDESHIRQLIDGMAMAEGFRPVGGGSRLVVLAYAGEQGGQITPYSPRPGDSPGATPDSDPFMADNLIIGGLLLAGVFLVARVLNPPR